MRPKMLYFMVVSWYWLYQRPHILAEKLSDDYDVTVVYLHTVLECRRKPKDTERLKFRKFLFFPFQEKNKFIEKISYLYNKMVHLSDLEEFEYIFIGHPMYMRFISPKYYGKIVYDCMDDYVELSGCKKFAYNIFLLEKRLINRCDLLIVSSEFLKKELDNKYGIKKGELIRNAASIEDTNHFIKRPVIKKKYILSYIGTISEWFDYDTLIESLSKINNIEYRLIGSASIKREHLRICYEGIIKHNLLFNKIDNYDALVMPFTISNLILAVDPVKLYEYIAFGKCIISIEYPEIHRFDNFIYFYNNTEEYIALVEKLVRDGFPAKYTEEQRRDFLSNNTWDCRYTKLKNLIKKI